MATTKQIQANRRNARKSTGPKSKEGKAIVSFNPLKHGLRAEKALLLPGEDSGELDRLVERAYADLVPMGEVENLLVEQIVSAVWRLRRICQIETGILAWEYYDLQATMARREAGKYRDSGLLEFLGDNVITDERKHKQALQQAEKAEEMQKSEITALGLSFVKSQDAFTKLARYQATIERSLYRALDHLERLQVNRKAREDEGNTSGPVE